MDKMAVLAVAVELALSVLERLVKETMAAVLIQARAGVLGQSAVMVLPQTVVLAGLVPLLIPLGVRQLQQVKMFQEPVIMLAVVLV